MNESINEWDQYLRRLTLERQRGMPRWQPTPAPERTPHVYTDDSPSVVAQRRKEIEDLEDEEKAQRRHLRRIA